MRESSAFFKKQQKLAPYLFVIPFVLTFCIFSAYPYIKSLTYSLYATSGPKDSKFVGLANYQFLWSDPDFWTAVKNTALFAFLSVAIQLPLSLGLALLLSQKWIKGVQMWRLAVFMPNLMGQVAVGVLFGVLLQPKCGLVNIGLAQLLGVSWLDQKWLSEPQNVLPALVLVTAWMSIGYNMIYFLAALQNVDQELIEAAMVDGANAAQRFRAVTLPTIAPVMAFVLVTMTVGSFQLYELPRTLLNGGGPDNRGLTIIMYLFNNGLLSGDLGYASAVGWTLAVMLAMISGVQIWLSGTAKKEA
ncbi:carbohydrate ABC transporter permease [Armatimonas sp.]|uniref:carbohydrate ABC transporter permease n=1 Tax=Armatimonas sp. TaxID=1872638 RepID=UPI003752369D